MNKFSLGLSLFALVFALFTLVAVTRKRGTFQHASPPQEYLDALNLKERRVVGMNIPGDIGPDGTYRYATGLSIDEHGVLKVVGDPEAARHLGFMK